MYYNALSFYCKRRVDTTAYTHKVHFLLVTNTINVDYTMQLCRLCLPNIPERFDMLIPDCMYIDGVYYNYFSIRFTELWGLIQSRFPRKTVHYVWALLIEDNIDSIE